MRVTVRVTVRVDIQVRVTVTVTVRVAIQVRVTIRVTVRVEIQVRVTIRITPTTRRFFSILARACMLPSFAARRASRTTTFSLTDNCP